MKSPKGQVILILVLVMTVALAIGLSVIQRSLSDIATSSKVEESSRAFSAAEAGIEKAIQTGTNVPLVDLGNNSSINDAQVVSVPDANQAFEFPPLPKEDLAQVWLANPSDLSQVYTGCTSPGVCFLEIYWGNVGATGADKPAIEISVIYQDTSNAYLSKKYFLDQDASVRGNGFDANVNCPSDAIQTSLSATAKTFLCKKRIAVNSTALPNLSKLILLRARLLYNSTSQAFAVKPITGSLPVQGKLFTATGISGVTKRKVQVLRQDKVVPPYFDFAIFSMGEINK